MIRAIGSAAASMVAQQTRLDAAASNVANIRTVGRGEGGSDTAPAGAGSRPYTPLRADMTATQAGGVVATLRLVSPPFLPEADAEGGVQITPNTSLEGEMLQMRLARAAHAVAAAAYIAASETEREALRILE